MNRLFMRAAWSGQRILGAAALVSLLSVGAPPVAVAEAVTLENAEVTVEPIEPLPSHELEALVGPIALYPDDLLSIVLAASTYPLQVVQAARFLDEREAQPGLKPDEAWDDSVVALLNYPEALALLNEDLDWTWKLGQAVLVQQEEVLTAVADFRERARVAGNLESDERQVVEVDDQGVIEIKPVDPEVIYVPYYEPRRVTVYHDYPVYHYYPRPYPVYYYPYPAGYRFSAGYFWGVTSAFSIGWHTHRLHLHHHSFYGHPYYGRTYYHDYYYRRPHLSLTYNYYRGHTHYRHAQRRHHPGNYWHPRRHFGGASPRYAHRYHGDRYRRHDGRDHHRRHDGRDHHRRHDGRDHQRRRDGMERHRRHRDVDRLGPQRGPHRGQEGQRRFLHADRGDQRRFAQDPPARVERARPEGDQRRPRDGGARHGHAGGDRRGMHKAGPAKGYLVKSPSRGGKIVSPSGAAQPRTATEPPSRVRGDQRGNGRGAVAAGNRGNVNRAKPARPPQYHVAKRDRTAPRARNPQALSPPRKISGAVARHPGLTPATAHGPLAKQAAAAMAHANSVRRAERRGAQPSRPRTSQARGAGQGRRPATHARPAPRAKAGAVSRGSRMGQSVGQSSGKRMGFAHRR